MKKKNNLANVFEKVESGSYCVCARWSKKVAGVKNYDWEKWSPFSELQKSLTIFRRFASKSGARRYYDFALFIKTKNNIEFVEKLQTASG